MILVKPMSNYSLQLDSEATVWITQDVQYSEIGELNIKTGSATWISLPQFVGKPLAASSSYSKHYLSVVMFNKMPNVYIYQMKRGASGSQAATLFDVLEGYSEAIWSPDSDELLLSKTYWDDPIIWKAGGKIYESVSIANDICSAQWGTSSMQILVSKCEDDRSLLVWDRLKKKSTIMMHFNYKVGDTVAAFAELHAWSPDRHKLLIFTYTSAEALPAQLFEMPVILTGYWQVLDIDTKQIETLTEKMGSSTPRIGFFRSPNELVIGINTAAGSELRVIRLGKYLVESNTFFQCKNNCVEGVVALVTWKQILLKLSKPSPELKAGLYLWDVMTGAKTLLATNSKIHLLPAQIGTW